MEITERILPLYSPYQTSQEYFNTYTLTGRSFDELSIPVLALTAADDPMIPVQDFFDLQGNQKLHIHVERYGGHCGFLQTYRFQAWYEELIDRTFFAFA
jgi:predicted alpha/beta-fold hydrolase